VRGDKGGTEGGGFLLSGVGGGKGRGKKATLRKIPTRWGNGKLRGGAGGAGLPPV